MKKVYKDKITNIDGTDKFDNKFLLETYKPGNLFDSKTIDLELVFMSELLEKKKNNDLLKKISEKPAMYSNVYSPKDELEIFESLFENAIKDKKRIHIVGVTLKEELEILEKYYFDLGFFREETNTFSSDFSIPFVTVSVNIQNLMWRGSDYKAYGEKIFFNPPIRESGQVKAMFKGINRGVIAGIYIDKDFYTDKQKEVDLFLNNCINDESILALTLAKILNYNYLEIGFNFKEKRDLIISF